jgi:hypothetical protein
VIARFEGTDDVWPKGLHVRSGRILKRGPAGGWLVRIFRPIMERVSENNWLSSTIITCLDNDLTVVK